MQKKPGFWNSRKEALEHFFPDFLAFFFPDAYAGIDWDQGYQFLDKELKQAARDAELGRRYADVLVQVRRLSGQEAWVLVSDNPFATVVMAHLKAQETRHDPVERRNWKLSLTRRLYRLGYDRQRVIDLFGFIDWVLQLPGPQELAFWNDVREIEEEKHMRYVTSIERIGMEQGMEQGLQQGLLQGQRHGQQQGQAELVLRLLARRFGAVPAPLAERVRATPSAQMPALQDIALDAASLDQVAAALETLLAEADPAAV